MRRQAVGGDIGSVRRVVGAGIGFEEGLGRAGAVVRALKCREIEMGEEIADIEFGIADAGRVEVDELAGFAVHDDLPLMKVAVNGARWVAPS